MSKLCLLEIEFTLLPQKRREFAQSLEFLTGSEQGLIRRSVYVDRDEPERVLWVEEWSNLETLEGHLETAAFRALVGGLRVLGNVLDCRLVDFGSDRGTGADGRR
jgi:quinol monooxygenase YgiN